MGDTRSRDPRLGLDPVDIEALLWDVRRVCTWGRMLAVGCGDGSLVQHLLSTGADAFGVDEDAEAIAAAKRRLPNRCAQFDGDQLPHPDASFDTLIGVRGFGKYSDTRIEQFARECHRVARRHVWLRVGESDDTPHVRETWDARFIRAGFRRHPALFRVVDYARLDTETTGLVLVYERIPDAALATFPLETLAAERELHMDMLREPGRRSDAHLQRYAFAASLVRPNDVVLDVACGLGYGIATIASTGRAATLIGIDDSEGAIAYARKWYRATSHDATFLAADAQDLPDVADASVHLVVSFETLEHLPARPLSPQRGARADAWRPPRDLGAESLGRRDGPRSESAPPACVDADGLRALFQPPFLVETMAAQAAGGGMRAMPGRAWAIVDADAPQSNAAEWWIAVAMKDPLAGADVRTSRRCIRLRTAAIGRGQ